MVARLRYIVNTGTAYSSGKFPPPCTPPFQGPTSPPRRPGYGGRQGAGCQPVHPHTISASATIAASHHHRRRDNHPHHPGGRTPSRRQDSRT